MIYPNMTQNTYLHHVKKTSLGNPSEMLDAPDFTANQTGVRTTVEPNVVQTLVAADLLESDETHDVIAVNHAVE